MEYEVIKVSSTETEYEYIKRTDPDGVVWSIPCDENNSDYQAYLAYLAEQEN